MIQIWGNYYYYFTLSENNQTVFEIFFDQNNLDTQGLCIHVGTKLVWQ